MLTPEQVVTRLQAECPSIQSIEYIDTITKAWDQYLTNVAQTPGEMPQAHIALPTFESGGDQGDQTYRQSMRTRIELITIARGPSMETPAQQEWKTVLDEIFKAFHHWQADPMADVVIIEDVAPVVLMHGHSVYAVGMTMRHMTYLECRP